MRISKTISATARASSEPVLATDTGSRSLAEEQRTQSRVSMNHELLQHAIARAAYFRAQQRGFAAGCELDDWLVAEGETRSSMFGGTEHHN